MRALKIFVQIALGLTTSACVPSAVSRPQSLQISTPQESPIDFPRMMLPIPDSAAFHDPGYFVWCATMVEGDDGKYNLYYSRWKTSYGSQSWVTSSEIAHAIGDSPEGPFVFHDVALPPRGKQYWDGLVSHNPTILHFGKKYYLYYMGDTGNGMITPHLNYDHRNNQRIGVAVAENPNGPWKRFSHPVIDISKDPKAADSLCVTNPSVTRGPDGKFRMIYKAVGRQNPLPFGGPVVHMMATSNLPTGPFEKDPKALFTVSGSSFPFEDPFLWYDAKRNLYFLIMKDNVGIVAGTGKSTLLLYQSNDASNWVKSGHFIVSDLVLHWKQHPAETVKRMERPQVAFSKNGDPIALIVAIEDDGKESYSVRIPLSLNHDNDTIK